MLVVIDETGDDFTDPKGRVDVLRLSDRERVASIDLGGQPDSIAINDDGSIAAIAMENQRDEENTDVDGGLPQPPTGFVQTLDLTGDPSGWTATPIRFHDDAGNPLPIVAAAGLDNPEDLEPEYVSINSRNELAVTLQENNGVAVINLGTREITSVFSAGTVSLDGVDTEKDGLIDPSGSITDVPREPDAVGWIDDDHLATANEGDWKGGSRGWTVWDTAGNVVWDAGTSVEELATRYGLHNEDRAGKKGPEIEGLAVATMNGTRYAFVASERSNFVAVYDVDDPADPRFVQLLFSTNGPEGILPIPGRNLLAVSSETDDSDALVRSSVNLYELGGAVPATEQPSIVSDDDASGHAIGWTALGSLTGDPADASTLYAASDAALAEGRVYTIDASQTPARIVRARSVTEDGAAASDLDIGGLDARADGGSWLTSEGRPGRRTRSSAPTRGSRSRSASTCRPRSPTTSASGASSASTPPSTPRARRSSTWPCSARCGWTRRPSRWRPSRARRRTGSGATTPPRASGPGPGSRRLRRTRTATGSGCPSSPSSTTTPSPSSSGTS